MGQVLAKLGLHQGEVILLYGPALVAQVKAIVVHLEEGNGVRPSSQGPVQDKD